MNGTGLTGIIPFTYFITEQKPVGSTFLRVDNLVSCAPDFEKWVHGKKYDALIFQKAYWREMMELFPGPKILDLCDPDWLRESLDIVELGNLVHAITCSSESLTALMRGYFPRKIVEYVPDRLNPAAFPAPRVVHSGAAKQVVWFGFIHNAYAMLEQLLPALRTHSLSLTIISNVPYEQEDGILALNPAFFRYDQKTVYEHIKTADIVLNPRSDRAVFKYKSLNKSLIGWKLGVPVANTNEDIERLMDPEERNREVWEKQTMIERDYHIERSAVQYREILRMIRASADSV